MGPYICSDPEAWVKKGELVGEGRFKGQCAMFVEVAAGAPQTRMWKQGARVRGNKTIQKGTAIATFVNGVYPNQPTNNHAAIYDSQDATGIYVYDQWAPDHPPSRRRIPFRSAAKAAAMATVGAGTDQQDVACFDVVASFALVYDGDAYSVIE